jgi:DNA-binding response OmpR family regulator/nitrogen-specific signal transduction histidine kinase
MQQPHIMLIEDSRTQAEYLTGLFNGQGWSVTHTSSGEAALDLLNQDRPDLVVLDYHLPGIAGDEFCRKLRMNFNTRGMPVLMLTVDQAWHTETHSLESGADDYLAKSVAPEVLLVRVRSLLRKSPAGDAVLRGADPIAGRARLLAIDDSPTYRQFLLQELASESYSVEGAASGQEGLEKFQREAFDGVLIDLEMPDIDGLEVCRRFAEIRGRHDNPAVLLILTAHEELEYMTRGLESGADDFIPKSTDIGVLKARVRALLRRKSFLQENRRIVDELKSKELEAWRARAQKEAAELRALVADELARSNQELQQANQKLEEALAVTRAITQNAAEALFMLDAAGRVMFVNPAAERIFGHQGRELLGKNFHERFLPPGAPPLPPGDYERVFLNRDGRAIDVACSNAPIVQDGCTVAAVLVVHDISQKKRAEEQLRQAQKLESIGVLAGGVAHDFNNILTSIIGNASLIGGVLPPATAERVEVILRSAERAADLTRQLLAYAGKGRWVVESVNLSTLVSQAMNLVRVAVPQEIEIRLALSLDLPEIQADRLEMQQILMNLVTNAGEAIAAADCGSIAISTGSQQIAAPLPCCVAGELKPGRYIFLEVADTGCGMDHEIRARMFDPFFTTKFTGRGLGLAAVAGIVRIHRGGILVETAPARGARFRVLLPADD